MSLDSADLALSSFRRHHFAAGSAAGAGEFAKAGTPRVYAPDLQLEPTHLDISLSFDLPGQTAEGRVATTVRARCAGEHVLTLDAVDFREVRVTDAAGADLPHRYDGEKLRIWRDNAPFAAGEEWVAVVHYRVVKPIPGLMFVGPTPGFPDTPLFVCSDNESERARYWLPCIDQPEVRPTLDFHLRGEQRFTMLANGIEVGEETHDDGTKTVHWKLEQPCPSYITCVACGEMVRADDGEFEGRPIAYFAPKNHNPQHLLNTFRGTGEMLKWLQDKFGLEFPYPKYYQLAAPYIGGAMENVSLVTWDDMFVLNDELLPELFPRVAQVNLHEAAHSYFGDTIICRDFAHAWLKESWAVYTETLYLEDTAGRDEAVYDFYINEDTYFGEADGSYMRPIMTREFESSWDMYDRHLYPGGAARLHMLRGEIGDAAFFAGTRDYVQTYAGQAVETDDFRKMMEKHSGKSLGKFFDQWFASLGYPKLKASFSYDSKARTGSFDIEQTQVDKKKNVPAFEFTLDLGWIGDGGNLQTRTVTITDAKHTFVVPMGTEPSQVVIDPQSRTMMRLEFNPGTDKLKSALKSGGDVITRIRAGQELIKTGKRGEIEAVRDAYADEPFWGVRAEWAKALGDANSEAAIEALVQIVGSEQHPRVMSGLFTAAGNFRDTRIAEALTKRLDAGDLPPLAAAAAMSSLGQQRDAAPVDRLIAEAGKHDQGGFRRAGAIRGLAASRADAAVEFLAGAVKYGAGPNDQGRYAAILALAGIAKTRAPHERGPVIEQLTDLLRDPVPRAHKSAVGALKTLRAAQSAGAVEAYKATQPTQDQPGIDRALKVIRKGDGPAGAEFEKQVTDLRDEVRKLADTVQKLQAKLDANGDEKPAE
jgi:aminopeptidase N